MWQLFAGLCIKEQRLASVYVRVKVARRKKK